ncbi:purine-nucleoside phosphorylase [Zhouia amylolytica]|uniref:Uridine phosphorylase n=2 Tax=Zhouia amylolytica TaxID=376730 RepID=W2UNU6_9FLAO|nr:purine-nucleoside phosphorylase [Zhouia amylolytica]ETN95624.1 purine-nucleoside phosphorylase [Zhouia amylolytica AD3]MCQ0110816.1 purine-nucleoside phosphorylase [Zhouia amylolytica]SFS57306.1 purine-nucleoside phosphorylase [Zhouia amylolytica]
MSVHIGATNGDIAENILLPGDPLRAKWIAETFFDNPKLYNEVRGMYGYTGVYKGKRVSVQGTGMGIPSIGIYVNELINEYGAKKLIRVGTAGSYQSHIKIRDVVLAMSASTNSSINRFTFNAEDYAPTANFDLLLNAYTVAKNKSINVKAGNVLTSDVFYQDNSNYYKKWAKYGVLCVEMETAALYTIAAKYNVQALSILTISDSLVTHESSSTEDRETSLHDMVEIALDCI